MKIDGIEVKCTAIYQEQMPGVAHYFATMLEVESDVMLKPVIFFMDVTESGIELLDNCKVYISDMQYYTDTCYKYHLRVERLLPRIDTFGGTHG